MILYIVQNVLIDNSVLLLSYLLSKGLTIPYQHTT